MRFKFFIAIIFIPILIIHGQSDVNQRFEEMQNAIILGLEDKALNIGHQLLSLPEYAAVKEKTLFFLGELFLNKALVEDNINRINSAYTILKMYEKEYPAGQYAQKIKQRINYIEETYQNLILFGNLTDEYNSERIIVSKKIEFAYDLLQFNIPNSLSFFMKTEQNQSGIDLTNKYFDDVIINNPRFKVFGYYNKILSLFGNYFGHPFISSKLFELKNQVYKESGKGIEVRIKILDLLQDMSNQFPSHPLTLDLHLICAKEFMKKSGNGFDPSTLYHLQFILDNDKDKLSARYLLVKEFVLNNKFQ